MLNSTADKLVPGVAGVVQDGILPGFYGYETGQAAVGDAFEWVRRLLGAADFKQLTLDAARLPVGSEGVRCVDWFNGCRTPLMDGALTGSFTGLTLNHGPAHLFRSVLEASACGLRWIVETLRQGGVPVKQFVATGGLPHHSPFFLQICADVLNADIVVPETTQGPAVGAAILGALAAGAFPDANSAIKAMAQRSDQPGGNSKIVKPNPEAAAQADSLYSDYLKLTSEFSKA
jgi:L-ribulokinase